MLLYPAFLSLMITRVIHLDLADDYDVDSINFFPEFPALYVVRCETTGSSERREKHKT
jgi:hypothetical protein